MICEKTDRFTPGDVAGNLVVLALMLSSASRQNNETLKVFKDSGAFGALFPIDDDVRGHTKLLERFPNLDAFGDAHSAGQPFVAYATKGCRSGLTGLFPHQMKTPLGNTLRVLSPSVILEEGHRACSKTAQDTLRGLNPSVIVELSATPTDASNVLADIKRFLSDIKPKALPGLSSVGLSALEQQRASAVELLYGVCVLSRLGR